MPWHTEPAGNGKVFVVDDKGKKYSEKPMSKWQAKRQMRALYASEPQAKKQQGGFHVFKGADGAYRWVTISSSAFKDRDGEIVTERALAEDCERCDTNKQYGPLRWWHIGGWEAPDGVERWDTWKATPGVDLGTCDFNMLHGKMLIESGTFKDATIGKAFAEAQENLEVSIAFSHPPGEPGEAKQYQNIHRFERSLLPAGMASNLLTKTYVLKGDLEMKNGEKIKALAAILRDKPELARQILDDAENVQKAAEAVGLEFKDIEDMLTVTDPDPAEKAEGEKKPEPEAEAEKPEPQAETPAPEAPEPEGDEIGDMTHDDLAIFVTEVVKQLLGKKEDEAALKEVTREQQIAEIIASVKATDTRFASIEHTMEETKQQLFELTDARPVGIKQMQSMRATERTENVLKGSPPTGPQMDPDFMKFALGGK